MGMERQSVVEAPVFAAVSVMEFVRRFKSGLFRGTGM